MPILNVEMICVDDGAPDPALSQAIADAAGGVFGTDPGHTWVRVRRVPPGDYAENGEALPDEVRPVIVTVIKARVESGQALKEEVRRLTEEIAGICGRPAENVHLIYEPDGVGRVAFGGNLVE